MANSIFSLTQADIALLAATAKDVIAIKAPSAQKIVVRRIWLEFDGVTAGNNHVLAEVYRATGTSTGTSIATNACPIHAGEPVDTNCSVHHTVTAGLTPGDRPEAHRIHPTSGFIQEEALGQEVEVAPGNLLMLRCTAPQAVNVTVGMRWEE